MYNKLFTKILDSSIWLESVETRLVWMTCLAVMDEDGFVQFASVANLSHRARVSLEAAQEAIQCLEGPDPNSSDPEHEGRRLERVPGGWLVLNRQKYAAIATRTVARERTRERVRRHRANRKVKATPGNASATVGNEEVASSSGGVTPSETDTETDVCTAPTIVGAPPAAAGLPTAEDVVDVWNTTVTAPIPKVFKLTVERKRKIRARLQTYPDLDSWRTCIAWLNSQDYCRAAGTGEYANWTATFDWLIRNDGQMAKQLERLAAEDARRASPDTAAEPARPLPETVLTGLRGVIGDEVLHDAQAVWRGRSLLLGVSDPTALDSLQHAIEARVLAQAPDAVVEVVQVGTLR